ncbi:hypothetical protein B0H17DRAFT_1071643 [Mycena rosella]|uniref:Uncharacterized protein n=1 Tax=Mycena rosella TaxID=1033263 RepID=A0AAD7GFQ2_MYCRO|nr:hypothetical protein B0H17DRAFT_1071643 [Mycena rosella]
MVDPEPPRQYRLQVLALGFPRTGTACESSATRESVRLTEILQYPALKNALETLGLGYVPTGYGSAAGLGSPEKLDMWIAAIRAKFYGQGTRYGRAEWDRLFGDCQVGARMSNRPMR